MYCYQVLADKRVLVIKHSGEFLYDEGNRALLDVLERLDAKQLASMRLFVRDCHDVTEATLKNTDRANETIFERKLTDLLESKGCLDLIHKVPTLILEPNNPRALATMRERVRRTRTQLKLDVLTIFKESYSDVQRDYPDFDLTLSADWIFPAQMRSGEESQVAQAETQSQFGEPPLRTSFGH